MTPEQREELKALALKVQLDYSWREPWEDYRREWEAASTPSAILSLIAQVEALTVPKWISVKEGLPDLDDPVWLFEDGRAWIGGRSDGGDGWLWCNCDGTQYLRDGVWHATDFNMDDDYQPSHWMPLTAAPTIPAIPGTKEGA